MQEKKELLQEKILGNKFKQQIEMKERDGDKKGRSYLKMEQVLTFEVLKKIFSDCNFNMAHYLRIISKLRILFDLLFESYYFKDKEDEGSEIELKGLKKILNYKDLRSVINWCKMKGVFVLGQGNNQFVNKYEFLLAFHKPFIKDLKSKHKNWKEMFVGYLKGDMVSLLAGDTENSAISKPYRPNSKTEVSFLDKIRKL